MILEWREHLPRRHPRRRVSHRRLRSVHPGVLDEPRCRRRRERDRSCGSLHAAARDASNNPERSGRGHQATLAGVRPDDTVVRRHMEWWSLPADVLLGGWHYGYQRVSRAQQRQRSRGDAAETNAGTQGLEELAAVLATGSGTRRSRNRGILHATRLSSKKASLVSRTLFPLQTNITSWIEVRYSVKKMSFVYDYFLWKTDCRYSRGNDS